MISLFQWQALRVAGRGGVTVLIPIDTAAGQSITMTTVDLPPIFSRPSYDLQATKDKNFRQVLVLRIRPDYIRLIVANRVLSTSIK